MTVLTKLVRNLLFLLPRVLLVGMFLFVLAVTVLSNFDSFEPYLAPLHMARAPIRPLNGRIQLGPYPHLDEMARLKRNGVEVIVSLLDTSLPQEKALAEREAKNARRLGMELQLYPLGYLPVRSERNRRTRDEIVRLLGKDRRKAYLHCYLGRHRVEFVADGLREHRIP